jgi:hypothetical protein
VGDTWTRERIDDLKRKTYLADEKRDEVADAKALALEVLAHGASVNRIVLKQYRDGQDLDTACYQALIHASSTITSVYDIREIERPINVRVHRWAGHPIVDVLGLKVTYQESMNGEVIDVIQPARPFWMRLGMKEDLATVACYRGEDAAWRIVHPWFEAAPADPARRLAGQRPYFRRASATRVGSWLARAPATPVGERPICGACCRRTSWGHGSPRASRPRSSARTCIAISRPGPRPGFVARSPTS